MNEKNYGKRKTFDLLSKINELKKLSPEGDLLMYKINFFNEDGSQKRVDHLKEDEILHDLQKWGVLKIEERDIIDGEIIYYINVFPKFQEVYLDHKNLVEEKNSAGKLNFYPKDGMAEYKTVIKSFKGKARAFLSILFENKNTTFSVDDIKKYCNSHISNEKIHFKARKDISDALGQIRKGLKVNKGEFFPIFKKENGWIWLEK